MKALHIMAQQPCADVALFCDTRHGRTTGALPPNTDDFTWVPILEATKGRPHSGLAACVRNRAGLTMGLPSLASVQHRHVQAAFLEVQEKGFRPILVLAVYVKTSLSGEDYAGAMHRLEPLLEEARLTGLQVLVVGDFNATPTQVQVRDEARHKALTEFVTSNALHNCLERWDKHRQTTFNPPRDVAACDEDTPSQPRSSTIDFIFATETTLTSVTGAHVTADLPLQARVEDRIRGLDHERLCVEVALLQQQQAGQHGNVRRTSSSPRPTPTLPRFPKGAEQPYSRVTMAPTFLHALRHATDTIRRGAVDLTTATSKMLTAHVQAAARRINALSDSNTRRPARDPCTRANTLGRRCRRLKKAASTNGRMLHQQDLLPQALKNAIKVASSARRKADIAYQQHLANLCRKDPAMLWKAHRHSFQVKKAPLVSHSKFAQGLRNTFERDHDPGNGPAGFLQPNKKLSPGATEALAAPLSPFEIANALQDTKTGVACAGFEMAWLKEARRRLLPPNAAVTADLIVSFDGGKRQGSTEGSEPLAAAAFSVVWTATGEEVDMGWAVCAPEATSNEMEYMGCIEGLRAAVRLQQRYPCSSVLVRGDSMLVMEQVFGTWRVREKTLMHLHHAACALAESLPDIQAQWQRREHNQRADELCNQAMDMGAGTHGGVSWQAPPAEDIPTLELGCPRPRSFAFAGVLTALLQRMLDGQEIPATLMAGVACMLPKTQPPSLDPAKYRPIVMVHTLCKLFALVMTARITQVVESAGLRPSTQFGFRAGMGCAHAQVVVQVCHEHAAASGQPLYVAFIDFAKAYDSVSRPLLWRRLEALGIPPLVVQAIQRYYAADTIQVGDEVIRPRVGVRQGCPLSPLLFGLFLDGLSEYLATTCPDDGVLLTGGHRVRDVVYADDVNLLACTPESLRRLLDALAAFSAGTGMTVSVDKSTVMRCGAPPQHDEPPMPPFTYRTSEGSVVTLHVVTETQLLGLSFDSELGFRNADMRAKDPCCKRLWGVLERLSGLGIRHIRVRLAIMRAYVEGWSRYGGGIWGVYKLHDAGTFHAIDETVARVLRATLGTNLHGPATASTEVTLAEVAWPTVSMTALQGAASLFTSMATRHRHTNATMQAAIETSLATQGGWAWQLKSRLEVALNVRRSTLLSMDDMAAASERLRDTLPSWFWAPRKALAALRLAGSDDTEVHTSDAYFAHLHQPGVTPPYLKQWTFPAHRVRRLARLRCCDVLQGPTTSCGAHISLLPSTAPRDYLASATRRCEACNIDHGVTFFHLLAQCDSPAMVAARGGDYDEATAATNKDPETIGHILRRWHVNTRPSQMAALLKRMGHAYYSATC